MKSDRNYQYFSKAKELIKNRKYLEAYSKLKRLIKKEPNNVILKLEYAKILVELDKLDRARRIFEGLLETPIKKFAMFELGKLEVIEGNYKSARYYFETRLNYSSDKYSMLELAKLELLEGNYQRAKYIFKVLMNLMDFEDRYIIVRELLNLNIKLENYDKCLIYLNELSNLYSDYITVQEISDYELYIKYKLNKLENVKNISGYFNNQLVNYNENQAISHIKKHLTEDKVKAIHGMFCADINVESLFYKMKDKINDYEPINFGIYDKYTFEMENIIGNVMEIDTKYLCIITVCNTKDIISMYPILSKNKMNNKKTDNAKKCKKII